MIKVDQIMEIRDLHRQGHAIRDIARITGHSRNTVRKVLRGGHELRFNTPQRTSKLEPFKARLRQRYQQYRLSAVRLMEDLRGMGYTGSIATLRRFLTTLKAEEARRARLTVRFETPPGRRSSPISATATCSKRYCPGSFAFSKVRAMRKPQGCGASRRWWSSTSNCRRWNAALPR